VSTPGKIIPASVVSIIGKVKDDVTLLKDAMQEKLVTLVVI
jgi:hypothetical protein